MNPRRLSILFGSLILSLGLVACTEDASSVSTDNNNWNVGEGDATADASADTDADVDGEPERDSGADTLPTDTGIDVEADAGEQTPFTVEGLSSAPWYAVVPLTTDPAVTGSVYVLQFNTDMGVSIGFRDEVTGSWSIFGEDRVRLAQLENDGQPNQPEQLLLDADLDDDGNIEALELVIPRGNGLEPLILRFEQPATPQVPLEAIEGNWQSEQTYSDENGNEYRLALRALGGSLGYGAYNGAYIEFVSGEANTITFDTGETYWFLAPPATGDPRPALAGEIRVDDAGMQMLYAPRETAQGSGEFEAIRMQRVDGFTL